MAHSTEDQGSNHADEPAGEPIGSSIGDSISPGGGPAPAVEQGPDPVIGAGIALLGMLMMGTGGARDAHYVFDVGVIVAVAGAFTYVISVALSAMKQRRARLGGPPPSSLPPPPAEAA